MSPLFITSLLAVVLVVVLVVWAKKRARGYALHDAAAEGNLELMDALIKDGYAVDTLFDGVTPLHVSAMRGRIDAAKRLIASGASLNLKAQSGNGETPLHMAAMAGDCEMVSLLVEAGADINSQTSQFDPPVLAAARHGHKDAMGLLIEKGADLHATDDEGNTLLFRCVLAAETDVVDMLLKAGLDPDCRDAEKKAYALHAAMVYAAHTDNYDVVECLLEHGADPNVRDEHGMTPIKMAKIAAKDDLENLLRTYGAKG